ncbi:AraC family transcriptional regulator [Massilia oculi]|uniref:AraC family transcriptional regulator n=1 Tax=Massilia oculi TaxID=945844 RepID=UPI0028A92504|nr:AraC family transcriptional regulator [Massilia oculi]
MQGQSSHHVQQRLVELLLRVAPGDGLHVTKVPKLKLVRVSGPTALGQVLYQPGLCLLAQGSKQLLVGDTRIVHDSARHMVFAHDIRVSGQVAEASPEQPYLCVWLDIDPTVIASLLLEDAHQAAPLPTGADATYGIHTARTDDDLFDAVLRLCRLLETPRHIRQLAPLVYREIMYRLLIGEGGWQLAHFMTPGTQPHRIRLAAERITLRYKEPLRMEEIAQAANMSQSSLHHHFKLATRMTPLQYQKQLRLQEARRLLVFEAATGASAAHRVGYESASQFSREYTRAFGVSPSQDVRELRSFLLQPAPGAPDGQYQNV